MRDRRSRGRVQILPRVSPRYTDSLHETVAIWLSTASFETGSLSRRSWLVFCRIARQSQCIKLSSCVSCPEQSSFCACLLLGNVLKDTIVIVVLLLEVAFCASHAIAPFETINCAISRVVPFGSSRKLRLPPAQDTFLAE